MTRNGEAFPGTVNQNEIKWKKITYTKFQLLILAPQTYVSFPSKKIVSFLRWKNTYAFINEIHFKNELFFSFTFTRTFNIEIKLNIILTSFVSLSFRFITKFYTGQGFELSITYTFVSPISFTKMKCEFVPSPLFTINSFLPLPFFVASWFMQFSLLYRSWIVS